MKLKWDSLTIGSMGNNIYFLVDEETKDCVIIDPGFSPQAQLDYIRSKGWNLRQIWVTHGHFDHIAGVKALSEAFDPPISIAMTLESFEWSKANLPSLNFGVSVDEVPRVDIPLKAGMWLGVNPESEEKVVEVRDVSGHNPGSVMFYVPSLGVAIVGDAIFKESIVMTDFEGIDHNFLLKNIR